MNIIYFNAEKLYRLSYDYFYYENNFRLAEKYANAALKYDKRHIKTMLLKANILLAKDDTDGAVRILQKALKFDSKNSQCLYLFAKAYSIKAEYQSAIKMLDNIFKLEIKDTDFLSDCYELKISVLIALKKYKMAERILKTLNNRLSTDDIFYLEENFYKTVQNISYVNKDINKRILHVNF